ncbi:Glucan endo-1,3-beta-glucosidase GV [Dichanthelium oligosanthes]|uniref:Glucan endo-1,3-beta-glucosidase GV n=1 Tax=Dichanthelium oligosanthes TaxID=888268 RepID=A0A1E5WF16_9POAL|nr:Glucan endo-1,3-beta-glucosidase GV [Dichanthelium oligosanthes]
MLPDMQNLNNALSAAGFGNINVSTAVKMSVLAFSSPPSSGAFVDPRHGPHRFGLLAGTGSPLLANIYPYCAYRGAGGNIDLNYALLKPSSPTSNGPEYTNLFDAMTDAMYSAMEKVGGSNVPIVVSESGWPSDGGFEAMVENTQTYNQNLIDHVGNGTPKRPWALETYIFAMFICRQRHETE